MALSKEEQEQLDALQKKAEEPDPPAQNGNQRVENVNITIDLENEEQVKRAVRAGYLPASYLEDEEAEEEKPEEEEPPRRRQRYE